MGVILDNLKVTHILEIDEQISVVNELALRAGLLNEFNDYIRSVDLGNGEEKIAVVPILIAKKIAVIVESKYKEKSEFFIISLFNAIYSNWTSAGIKIFNARFTKQILEDAIRKLEEGDSSNN